VILNEIIRPDQDLSPGPTSNPLKSSAHCVKSQRQPSGLGLGIGIGLGIAAQIMVLKTLHQVEWNWPDCEWLWL